jgi:hypothetical protein
MAKKTNQYDFSLSYVHFIEHLPCVKKKPPLKHGKKLGNLEKQQQQEKKLFLGYFHRQQQTENSKDLYGADPTSEEENRQVTSSAGHTS